MSEIMDRILDAPSNLRGDVWHWFAQLSREEWVVVLAVISVLGFLCMLGYGSRSKY